MDITTDTPYTLEPIENKDRCYLIGGAFALNIQAFLAAVVLVTMMIKWIRENPRRSTMIWIYDTAKQGIAAAIGHLLNIIIAEILATSPSGDDECPWYFMNYTFDLVFGIPLCYFMLRFSEYYLFPDRPHSGDYGRSKDRIEPSIWLFQTTIWVLITSLSKIIIAIPLWFMSSLLSSIAAVIFQPMQAYPHAMLIFVMIFWPSLCNAFQFYIMDNFLKKNTLRRSSTHNTVVIRDENSSLFMETQ